MIIYMKIIYILEIKFVLKLTYIPNFASEFLLKKGFAFFFYFIFWICNI